MNSAVQSACWLLAEHLHRVWRLREALSRCLLRSSPFPALKNSLVKNKEAMQYCSCCSVIEEGGEKLGTSTLCYMKLFVDIRLVLIKHEIVNTGCGLRQKIQYR